ncbi:hypothetical protein C8J56DRAFT_1045963 [Mycena floridula]|nr:hypothetical protein C8J56DRAFT_1045963 [Mycena floridula]
MKNLLLPLLAAVALPLNLVSSSPLPRDIDVDLLCTIPAVLGIHNCIKFIISDNKKGIVITGIGAHQITGAVVENDIGRLTLDNGVQLCLTQNLSILGIPLGLSFEHVFNLSGLDTVVFAKARDKSFGGIRDRMVKYGANIGH